MKEKSGKPSLLLLELVIDLFLFLICAAVCVALLIHARSMSAESTQLTGAVYAAQTAAEQLRTGQDPSVDGYYVSWTDAPAAPGVRACTIAVSRDVGGKTLFTLQAAWPMEVTAP